jgi:peptide deformylase
MRPTVKYPDDILKQPCFEVITFDEKLHAILDEMAELMKAEKGLGLAANQAGYRVRAFVMVDQKGKVWEFVNPEITEKEGFIQINEGCLSAPGVFVQVPRAQTVTIKAQDRSGQEFTVVCQDVEAVCAQHEIDHLDGIFYLEKTSRNQRRLAMKQLGLK